MMGGLLEQLGVSCPKLTASELNYLPSDDPAVFAERYSIQTNRVCKKLKLWLAIPVVHRRPGCAPSRSPGGPIAAAPNTLRVGCVGNVTQPCSFVPGRDTVPTTLFRAWGTPGVYLSESSFNLRFKLSFKFKLRGFVSACLCADCQGAADCSVLAVRVAA